MPGLDPSRSFVPLAIAVLTVSDTRSLSDDRSPQDPYSKGGLL